MASPRSPALESPNSPAPSSLPLETLVSHFIAAKRSLSSTSSILRAQEIVTSARHLLEENAILLTKNTYIRRSVEHQLDTLEGIRAGIEALGSEANSEFRDVLGRLDGADGQLKAMVKILRGTEVEQGFQSEGAEAKTLHDFIDATAQTELATSLRGTIDRVNAAFSSLSSTRDTFASSVNTVYAVLDATPSRPDPVVGEDGQSPLPSLFAELESTAHGLAGLLESLVRHYDLSILALKHTEGGFSAANRAQSSLTNLDKPGMPMGSLHNSEELPPPLDDAERAEMMAVLDNDAAEVEDVVAEIRDGVVTIETIHEQMADYVHSLRDEARGLRGALQELSKTGRAVRTHIASCRSFQAAWEEEKGAIDAGMTSINELRAFYESFAEAYNGLLVEVERRRGVQLKMKKIAEQATAKIEELYEEDVREREVFRADLGDFLPSDLWPGLTSEPVRYLCTVAGDENTVPEVKKDTLEVAAQRLRLGR